MRLDWKHRLWLFPWLAAALLAGGPRSALADHDGRWLRSLRALDSDRIGGRIVIVRGDNDPIVIRDRIVDRDDRIVIRDRKVRRMRHRDRHRIVIGDPTGRVFVMHGNGDMSNRIRAQVDRILDQHLGRARGNAWRGHDEGLLRMRERVREQVRQQVRVQVRERARADRRGSGVGRRERSQRSAEIRREVRELQQEIRDLEEQLDDTP